jgi:hypothetical protein
VRATNVPLGYYESVLGRDARGRKRLYGFRYVGFLPYAHCPQAMGGVECNPCETADLYGLVFENDTMVFRRLSAIQDTDPTAQSQFSSSLSQSPKPPAQSKVTRTISYSPNGELASGEVQIVDEFSIPTPVDNKIYLPLPELGNLPKRPAGSESVLPDKK